MSIELPRRGSPQDAWERYHQSAHDALGLGGANFPLWSNAGVVPALSMLPDAVPSDLVTIGGGLKRYGFDASAEESLLAEIMLPSGYELGVALRPYVRWAPSTANAGVVRWGFEYAWGYDGVALPSGATLYADGTASAIAYAPQLETLEVIAGDKNRGPGSTLLIRVFRDAANAADTYADDALLLAAGVATSNNATGRAEVFV